MQLRQLGFDALHLVDPDFANEASMAYGSEAMRNAFLASAADAVALSGSEAMHILDISVRDLLRRVRRIPGERPKRCFSSCLRAIRCTTFHATSFSTRGCVTTA